MTRGHCSTAQSLVLLAKCQPLHCCLFRHHQLCKRSRKTPTSFHAGDKVFIIDNTPHLHRSRKLTNKYKGPFKCIKVDGDHLFLVPLGKPDISPLRWHAEFTKLAQSHDHNAPITETAHQHTTTPDRPADQPTEARPTVNKPRQKKQQFQHPLDTHACPA